MSANDDLKDCILLQSFTANGRVFHILTVVGTKEYFHQFILQVGMLKRLCYNENGCLMVERYFLDINKVILNSIHENCL